MIIIKTTTITTIIRDPRAYIEIYRRIRYIYT